jgi:hypothetical protein
MNCLNKGRQETAYSLPSRSVLPAIKATSLSPSKTQCTCGVVDCLHSLSGGFYSSRDSYVKGEREGGGLYRKESVNPRRHWIFRVDSVVYALKIRRDASVHAESRDSYFEPASIMGVHGPTGKTASCQRCKVLGLTASNTPIKQTKTTSGQIDALVEMQSFELAQRLGASSYRHGGGAGKVYAQASETGRI